MLFFTSSIEQSYHISHVVGGTGFNDFVIVTEEINDIFETAIIFKTSIESFKVKIKLEEAGWSTTNFGFYEFSAFEEATRLCVDSCDEILKMFFQGTEFKGVSCGDNPPNCDDASLIPNCMDFECKDNDNDNILECLECETGFQMIREDHECINCSATIPDCLFCGNNTADEVICFECPVDISLDQKACIDCSDITQCMICDGDDSSIDCLMCNPGFELTSDK